MDASKISLDRLKKHWFIIVFFLFLSGFLFRDYLLKGLVPFPANLLISFYQPYASYEWEGVTKNLGLPHKPVGHDNLRIFYPLRKVTIDEVKDFSWPLWNPYSFAGTVQLATYQSAVFHPASPLFFILPQIDAWSIIIMLAPFLASMFTYLFLRELALGRRASFFGALVFGFSPLLLVWMEDYFIASYSGLFLPLILYASEKMRKKVTPLAFLLFVLGLTFSLLSGWFQTTMYVWIFTLLWILYRRQHVILSIFGFILAILLSGIHLLPNIEAYLHATRGTTEAKFLFDIYLLPFSHLVTLLAPDFFGNPGTFNYFQEGFYHEKVLYLGIVPLFFVLYELLMLRKSSSHEKFFAAAWVVTLSLGFALPTSWLLLYQLKLPFFSTIIPSRIFFLTTFCGSILAAYGIEKYLGLPNKKKMIGIIVGLVMIFAGLWNFVLNYRHGPLVNEITTISLRNLILPTAVFIAMAVLLLIGIAKLLRRYVYIGLVILTFASSAYFAYKYFYFSEKRFVFPDVAVFSQLQKISGINRVWSFGKGYIERNLLTYYNLYSPEGYDSIYIKRYGELMQAAENNGIVSEQTPRVDATIRFAEKEEEILADPLRKKLLSLLGVAYIVGIARDDVEKGIWTDGVYTIYEYKEAYPRFFLASDYILAKGKQEIVSAMFDPQTDLRKTLILEEEPAGFEKKENANEHSVSLISYKPQKVDFSVSTSAPALIFLSDTYYPGWKAYVDGSQTKIYRADYTFRAVALPKGKHVVEFRYEPLSFSLGLGSSALGILLLAFVAGKIRYRV